MGEWSGVRTRGGGVVVCPHCWQVNPRAERLCGRCGGDMLLLLQESGGLRVTAPVQSPVPIRVGRRLSAVQRIALLGCVLLLALAAVAGAFAPPAPRRPVAGAVPAGGW